MKILKKQKFLVLLLALVLGAGVMMGAGNADFKMGKSMEMFFNLFRSVNMLYVDEVDSEKLIEVGTKAMLAELDPYTEFLPESEMADFEIATTGKYGGVGALIRKAADQSVEIAEVYKGFPADKAGLKIGDKILKVDAVDTKTATITAVSNAMKGTPGSKVKMLIEDIRTSQQREVIFPRERIAISGVSYSGLLNGEQGIGYVSLGTFTEGCSNDVRNAIINLRSKGNLKGLVLDLRDNGGGLFDEAVSLVSLFVPKGTEVVSMRGKNRADDQVYRTTTEPIEVKLPLVVLVDRSSASSSEIVAGALQDLDRAVVMGQRSFGKGLVQSTRPVGYGAYLKVTTAKYYIPSGRCIQALDYTHRNEDGSVGIVPDSLITEFKTAGGRKVYDGGGIMPDVAVKPEYASKFSMLLNGFGHFDDFANQYYKKNTTAPDARTFALSDQQYEEFVTFMKDRQVNYVSATEATLERLKKFAEQEKYLGEIEGELKAIEQKLKGDKNKDLMLYKDEIKGYLENLIILRYHYNTGTIERLVNRDPLIRQAAELLSSSEYAEILAKRDTQKK